MAARANGGCNSSGIALVELELIGVPFDSYARYGALGSGADVLRSEGLVDRLGRVRLVRDAGDLRLPAPVAERAPDSGLLNETALIALV